MASNITFNGVTYSIPAVGDDGWGSDLSAYFIAIASGALQKTGGTFTLTSEANFGATFGLKSAYLKSQATNPASAGILRLGNNESLSWRNAANNADLNLTVNVSDALQFNGANLLYAAAGLIVNADISPSAAISYSKLNLATSILNADISASAAIALSKLATVTASRALVSDGSGNISASSVTSTKLSYVDFTSSGQTQLDAKVPKTLTTTTGDMIYASSANTPARLPIGSSGQVIKSVGGIPTWATFSGGINYLSSNPDAEADTSGWATYADAAGTSPVDGTGGSPNSTWTRTTSSPLRGSASFLYTRNAGASRQGEGVSYAFTIDTADKAKVLQIEFDYILASGAFTAGSSSTDSELTVWVYDVTNSLLIQPSTYKLFSSNTSVPDKFVGNFQTASNSTSYRLIIHCGSSTNAAFTMQFDNFKLGPCSYVYGTPITDWQTWTPTGTWSANTTYTGRYRRVGDSMEMFVSVDLTGAPTGTFSVNTPSGFTIDTTKIAKTQYQAAGDAYGTSGSRATNRLGSVFIDTSSVLKIVSDNGATWNATSPGTFGNTDFITINALIPISGWSSNIQMSDSYDGRQIGFRANNSATTINGTPAKIVWTNTNQDDVAGYSSGTYTVRSAGWYDVAATLYLTGTPAVDSTATVSIYINGASVKDFVYRYKVASLTTTSVPISDSFYFNASDTIEIYASTDMTSPSIYSSTTRNIFTINKRQAPTTISATERVSAILSLPSGQALGSATVDTVIYTSKEEDTHGNYNSSTGEYRIQYGGRYDFTMLATCSARSSAAFDLSGYIYVNGVERASLNNYSGVNTVIHIFPINLTTSLVLSAGDIVTFRARAGYSGESLVANAAKNRVSILKAK